MSTTTSAHKHVHFGEFNPKQLAKGVLAASAAQIYPASGVLANRAVIRKIILTNVTAGAITATIRVRPAASAGTVADDILTALSVAANDIRVLDFGTDGLVLEAGQTVWALASGATSMNYLLSGGESHVS